MKKKPISIDQRPIDQFLTQYLPYNEVERKTSQVCRGIIVDYMKDTGQPLSHFLMSSIIDFLRAPLYRHLLDAANKIEHPTREMKNLLEHFDKMGISG